jgi:hypothetical protein
MYMECMKVPYQRTGIYSEGSIKINVTSQCAVAFSSFEPTIYQPGGFHITLIPSGPSYSVTCFFFLLKP